MDFRMHFIDTVEDLRARCGLRATEYDVTQAAGLMRRLILDGQSLSQVANREKKLHLNFRAHRIYQLTGSAIWVLSLASDPDMFSPVIGDTLKFPEGASPLELRVAAGFDHLGQFLRMPMLVEKATDGRRIEEMAHIQVRDAIREFSNKLGGVHVNVGGSTLGMLNKALATDPEPVFEAVAAVGRIVTTALEPLCALLYNDSRNDRRLSQSLADPRDVRGWSDLWTF